MKRAIIGFLQNAWSPVYAGHVWPRESWIAALRRSRSGQRLAVMENRCGEVEWHNTTPRVGDTPDSLLPPDLAHVRGIVEANRGATFIACGRQAANVLRAAGVAPLLILPHPACRVVTNRLYEMAGDELRDGIRGNSRGVVELRQLRGAVERRAS